MGIIGGPPMGGVGSMPGRGGPPKSTIMSIIHLMSTLNPMTLEKYFGRMTLMILKELHAMFGGG